MPRKITCHSVILSFETDSLNPPAEIVKRLLSKINEDQTPTDGDPYTSLGQCWVKNISLNLDPDEDIVSREVEPDEEE